MSFPMTGNTENEDQSILLAYNDHTVGKYDISSDKCFEFLDKKNRSPPIMVFIESGQSQTFNCTLFQDNMCQIPVSHEPKSFKVSTTVQQSMPDFTTQAANSNQPLPQSLRCVLYDCNP